jgi:hypothetical protein
MRVSAWTVAIVAAAGVASADPTAESVMGLVVKTAKCDAKKPAMPAWCAVSSWSTGTAALPTRPLVGLRMELLVSDYQADDLARSMKFAALAYLVVEQDGTMIRGGTAIADGPQDDREIKSDLVSVRHALDVGRSIRAIPGALAGGLGPSVVARPRFALAKGEHGWTWTAATGFGDPTAAELRKVGNAWVHIEKSRVYAHLIVGVYTEVSE